MSLVEGLVRKGRAEHERFLRQQYELVARGERDGALQEEIGRDFNHRDLAHRMGRQYLEEIENCTANPTRSRIA